MSVWRPPARTHGLTVVGMQFSVSGLPHCTGGVHGGEPGGAGMWRNSPSPQKHSAMSSSQ